jgi:hypothetical protein
MAEVGEMGGSGGAVFEEVWVLNGNGTSFKSLGKIRYGCECGCEVVLVEKYWFSCKWWE